jgi:hypothetical protein
VGGIERQRSARPCICGTIGRTDEVRTDLEPFYLPRLALLFRFGYFPPVSKVKPNGAVQSTAQGLHFALKRLAPPCWLRSR